MKMRRTFIVRNEDVQRVLIGVPEGHKHLRVYLELQSGVAFIFQEATIANILRGFITVKTHPRTDAVQLERREVPIQLLRTGFAKNQLLETPKGSREIKRELKSLLDSASRLGEGMKP